MAIPEPLATLLQTPGPSGHEARAATVWRDWCASFAQEVDVDSSGSSWARVPGTAGGPCLAVVGHIDEIGVHVTHIDDEGFLRFGALGGWDPVNIVGQRVVLATRDGAVHGVVGRKPSHLLDEEDRKRPIEFKGLQIDIGAVDGEQARSLVRIGDSGVIDAAPLELLGGRVVSRSLDNRVGCHVAARAGQLVAQAGGASGDYLALAVVGEELGYFGAQTSAYRHRPDVAIVVDVAHATDIPGFELGESSEHRLGSGPVIDRGPMLHPRVFELLHATAETEAIPFTLHSNPDASGTDADALHISRDGIPTGLVEVPLRYMHSAVEMIDPRDLEHAARLVAAFAMALSAETSFER
ncbi:MAG: M42 family peptidase [Solirubrobacteraceae bacterium]